MQLKFRVNEKHPNGNYVPGDNADAHPNPEDPLYGTICFRTVKDVTNLRLVVHELAHLQAESHKGHGKTWWYHYMAMLRGVDPEEYLREKRMYEGKWIL